MKKGFSVKKSIIDKGKGNTYEESLEAYARSKLVKIPFWAPFPGAPKLESSNFGGTLKAIDTSTLQIQASKVPAEENGEFVYEMAITGFKNPFSKKTNMQFVIKYYKECKD